MHKNTLQCLGVSFRNVACHHIKGFLSRKEEVGLHVRKAGAGVGDLGASAAQQGGPQDCPSMKTAMARGQGHR